VSGLTLRHPTMRELHRLALDRGWRVEQHGAELHWFNPDKTVNMVVTPMSPGDHDRGLANSVAQLRRVGLDIPRRRGMPESPEQLPAQQPAAELDPFVRSLADLIEEELARRTANLESQVQELEDRATALANDNADLRQKLKDCDEGIEQRAEQAALAAVREMLAQRRVPR